MKAPDYTIEAVPDTVKWAMVYCRYYAIDENADTKQVYELMEAVHDISDQMYRWSDNGVDQVKLHLSCFDHHKWDGSPDLITYFEGALERAKR